MFECVECGHEAEEFLAEVATRDQGSFLYRAKCPKCGDTKVNVTSSAKEQDLRISTERR